MKKEFCIRCNTTRDVDMTSSTIVDTGCAGQRLVIQTRQFHCKICKSYVRCEESDKRELLEGENNFTPRARSIWQSMPGDVQFKILNTIWCTRCRKMTGMAELSARVCSGVLVFTGKCNRCGSDVARVIDNR
jgi:hypothetical protein